MWALELGQPLHNVRSPSRSSTTGRGWAVRPARSSTSTAPSSPTPAGKLVCRSPPGVDRTLYFDFLPVKLPKLRGYTIRVQLYTVARAGPLQLHAQAGPHRRRRRGVRGRFGRKPRREANVESLQNLVENLREQGLVLEQDSPPLAVQQARTSPTPCPTAEMDNAPQTSITRRGSRPAPLPDAGVFEALKSITTQVLSDLRRRGVWRARGPGSSASARPTSPRRTAEDIRRKDRSRRVCRRWPTAARTRTLSLKPADSRGPPSRLSTAAMPGPRAPPSRRCCRPARSATAVVAVEYLLHRGRLRRPPSPRPTSSTTKPPPPAPPPPDKARGPALHALLLGLPGERYLRFRDTAARRAASGGASSADAPLRSVFSSSMSPCGPGG